MTQTMTRRPVQESVYTFISDAGSVTREEIVAFLAIDDLEVDAWLKIQLEAGNLVRVEFGEYSTSCVVASD